MSRRFWKLAFIAIITLSVIGGVLLALLYKGVIWFNTPSTRDFPVRGVDVSWYQGNIDWNVLASNGIEFAFIKATEGSTHKDRRFTRNWKLARQTGLAVAAYHFFSFESPGSSQAANFIASVPKDPQALPPVVDFEHFGKTFQTDANARRELKALLVDLERHYDRNPIIYLDENMYKRYIMGRSAFLAYPVWIRNIYTSPKLPDGRQWTFWQYKHREVLKGYDGPEKFIDMNVFNGSKAQFRNFVAGNTAGGSKGAGNKEPENDSGNTGERH